MKNQERELFLDNFILLSGFLTLWPSGKNKLAREKPRKRNNEVVVSSLSYFGFS